MSLNNLWTYSGRWSIFHTSKGCGSSKKSLAREVWLVDRGRCVSWSDFDDAMNHIILPTKPVRFRDDQSRQLEKTRLLALLGWTFQCQYGDNTTESGFLQLQKVTKTPSSLYRRLSDELMLFAGGECKDPRDQVYGLLGLCDPGLDYQVSYHKSCIEVLIDFVVHLDYKDSIVRAAAAIDKLIKVLPIEWKSLQARSDLRNQIVRRKPRPLDFVIKEALDLNGGVLAKEVARVPIWQFEGFNRDVLHLLEATEAFEMTEDLFLTRKDSVEIPGRKEEPDKELASVLRGREPGRTSLAHINLRLPGRRPPRFFVHPLDLVQIMLSKRTPVFEGQKMNFT